jgi:hypothetical protein
MAQSKTELFNLALTELGQDRCISPDDDTERVRALKANFDFVRDAVMSEHPWRFSLLRTTLPALAAAPAFGWARQFELPETCLKLVQVGDDWVFYSAQHRTFQLEGSNILTDEEAPLQVRYVQRVENIGLWPALFSMAVAYRLASLVAKKVTGSNTEAERVRGLYELQIRTAKRHNAIERPPEEHIDGSWLDARGD